MHGKTQQQDRQKYLIPRKGPRPTTGSIPHKQLDQWPTEAIHKKLVEYCLGMPGVRVQESRLATDRTLALSLTYKEAQGPADAFIDDSEFCHIHELPGGYLHLALPQPHRFAA